MIHSRSSAMLHICNGARWRAPGLRRGIFFERHVSGDIGNGLIKQWARMASNGKPQRQQRVGSWLSCFQGPKWPTFPWRIVSLRLRDEWQLLSGSRQISERPNGVTPQFILGESFSGMICRRIMPKHVVRRPPGGEEYEWASAASLLRPNGYKLPTYVSRRDRREACVAESKFLSFNVRRRAQP